MAYRRKYVRPAMRRRRYPYKRRRVVSFKRRRLVDRFQATSDINRGSIQYKRKKRLPYSKFRKVLFAASESQQKFRSQNAVAGVISSATTPQQGNVYFTAFIPDAGGGARFWQPLGGLIQGNETPVGTDFGGSDLFIRGGVVRHMISNPPASGVAVRVITWRLRITLNGVLPVLSNPFVVSQGWDPSLPDPALVATSPERDVWKNYKWWGGQEVMLKPGESFERVERIRAQKIDQDQWINNRGRDFWMIYVQNITNTAVLNLTQIISWSLAFTGDRVV